MTTTPLRLLLDHVPTPIGRFAVVVDDEGRVRAAGFTERHGRMEKELRLSTGAKDIALVPMSNPGGVSAAMEAYFGGDLAVLDSIPVFVGGTPFQRAVWDTLRTIPRGETRTYQDIARVIGNVRAVRAVGLANGSNPVAVIVPCHRVIGSDGTLTGYGGGVDRKEWLLVHERATARVRQLGLYATDARG